MDENSRDRVETSTSFDICDELQHPMSGCEEWSFSWWSDDAEMAGHTSYRLVGASSAWYCWALWRRGHGLMHVTEFDIARRPDPMIVKAASLWAEYVCDAPFEQWTLGNETYAVELEDPSEALGRAHGHVVPIASDLEFYATEQPAPIADGYEQRGRILGSIETEQGRVDVADLECLRMHRWSALGALDEIRSSAILEPRGPRLPFVFPDGTVRDLHLTSRGLQGAP